MDVAARKTFLNIVVILAVTLYVLLSGTVATAAERRTPREPRHSEQRFLIFHIDAVSSRDFFAAFDAGELPNIAAAFAGGHHIRQGLTLFPASTPVIYTRLKTGLSNSEGEFIGWQWYDRDLKRTVSEVSTFRAVLGHIPRRSRGSFIFGLPGFDFLAELAILNLPELLERYTVVELLWFNTDTWGHLRGTEAHRESLRRFDRALGRVLPSLETDDLNLILYADHGMTTDDVETVDMKAQVERVIPPSELLLYAYPNVYITDPTVARKDAFARALVRETPVDFAFYRAGSRLVAGHHREGTVFFAAGERGIRYSVEGPDPFGYFTAGYDGEELTADEWLHRTHRSLYPALPPNVYGYLSHRNTGDIVTVINPPKIPLALRANHGNHSGFTAQELMVPVLLRGPALEKLYGTDVLWLHRLYASIPELRFYGVEPERELHSVRLQTALDGSHETGFELAYSPAYRWRLNWQSESGNGRIGAEYDAFSTFLSRLWLGAGSLWDDGGSRIFYSVQLEVFAGKWNAAWKGISSRDGWESSTRIAYQLDRAVSVEWLFPSTIGVSFSW